MLYPQNGDRIVAIDSVTSLHPMYTHPAVDEIESGRQNMHGTRRHVVSELVVRDVDSPVGHSPDTVDTTSILTMI